MGVAIVARKSTKDERQVSIARQEQLGREWASKHRPADPVDVFSDNAVSGVKMDRPGWLAFVDAVRLGRIDTVWAYEQSRLTRAGTQTWEEVCVMLSVAGITEVNTHRQGTIGVAEGSRLMGRFQAILDLEEREVARIRTRDALDVLARAGVPTGAPSYGYRRIVIDGTATLEPHPDQAPVVERMVREIAAGDSLAVVARRLNEDGTPTLHGKQWIPQTVRAVVTAPRIVGKRVHRGQVIGAGNWPPLVDRLAWERVQTRLATHRPGRTVGDRRRYLLTGGLALCAHCDTPLISATAPAAGGARVPAYQCPHPTRGGCGRCSILADRLEDHVVTTVGGWLDDPDLIAAINAHLQADHIDTTPLRDELDAVDGRLADLAVRWANGDLEEVEHAAARRTLAERRAQLVAQLVQATPADSVDLDGLIEQWYLADHADRRPVIAALAEPARVRGAFADGRRLTTQQRVTVEPRWA